MDDPANTNQTKDEARIQSTFNNLTNKYEQFFNEHNPDLGVEQHKSFKDTLDHQERQHQITLAEEDYTAAKNRFIGSSWQTTSPTKLFRHVRPYDEKLDKQREKYTLARKTYNRMSLRWAREKYESATKSADDYLQLCKTGSKSDILVRYSEKIFEADEILMEGLEHTLENVTDVQWRYWENVPEKPLNELKSAREEWEKARDSIPDSTTD